MKKLLSILVLMFAVFGLFGCNQKTTETKTTKDEVTTTKENDLKPLDYSNEFRDDRRFLGMYHLTPVLDNVPNQIKMDDAINGDIFNVFLMSHLEVKDPVLFDEWCQKIYDAGKRFWIFDSTFLWDGNGQTYKNIYTKMNEFKEEMRSKPYYDAWLGYYCDEPLLAGIKGEEFRLATEAFAKTFEDKRFLVVFGVAAMSADYVMPAGRDVLTREFGEFITDIGYDIYGDFGDYYLEIWSDMEKMFEGMNKNYWAVPMAMNFGGRCTEQMAINSILGCYDVVKKSNGGVGMLLYNAYTYPASTEALGNIGFCDMCYTSLEEFKTWNTKGNPWKNYYNKFYNDDGTQVNPGVDFVPWTNEEKVIQDVAKEINQYNEDKFEKAKSLILCDNNQEFVYDGDQKVPVVKEFIPGLKYEFASKTDMNFTAEAPTEVGEYYCRITLEESLYRTAATANVAFKIVESTETCLVPRVVIEDYASPVKTVAFDLDNLQISYDGINYTPYEKATPIDVTDMIVREGYNKTIYVKQGDKTPAVYRVKKLESISVGGFEKAKNATFSDYDVTGIIKHSGDYSGKLRTKLNASIATYVSEQYFYPDYEYKVATGENYSDISNGYAFEFYIYSAKDLDVKMWLIGQDWTGIVSSDEVHVEKNTWTKCSFNLSNFIESSGYPEYCLSHALVFTLLLGGAEENTDVFIDDVSILGLN